VLIEFRRVTENLGELQTTRNQAVTLAAEAEQLTAKKSKLPALTDKKLKKLRQLDGEIRELRARVEASGLTVTLCAQRDGSIQIETDREQRTEALSLEKPHTLKAAQRLALNLPKWGTIRIASGAAEVGELEKQ